jgi:dTDP-glucose 4,6-dehydratase
MKTQPLAVVTGGAGFLGSHLCERLLGEGYRVVCVDDFSTGSLANLADLIETSDVRLITADVAHSLFIDEQVDVVLHFASPCSPIDYMRRPIDTLRAGSLGTINALELARENQARFVLASTSEIYGDPLVHPQPEWYLGNVNSIGQRSVYDEAKRFSEAATMAYRRHYGLDTAIVRIFNTFGPRMRADDGRVIPAFVSRALRGEPLTITGDGRQTRSYCYVSDLVEGVYRTLLSGHAGPINLGNEHEMSVLDLASLIQELTTSDSEITFIEKREDDPHVRRPDISLAVSVLGWRPVVPIQEGLESTIDWFTHVAEGSAAHAC